MLKNKLDYKLVNFLLVLLIILIVYETRLLWLFIIKTVFEIIKPLLIALMISYVCNLYLRKLNKLFNKYVSVLIFLFTVVLIFFVFFKLLGLIIIQLKDSFNMFFYLFKRMAIKYNLDIFDIYDKISDFTYFIPSTFNMVFSYITLFVVIISSSIYLLFDYKKIECRLKELIPDKYYNYISTVNKDIENYTCSFLLLGLFNIVEYSIIFKVVGHPNYLFLGILSGVLSLIPMFGGLITNGLALITAFMINYGLFIRTIIGILILSILDGYIVSPIVYSKANKMHPLMVILSIYTCSKLFGFFGLIIALPLLVIITSNYKYIKK